MPIEGEDSLDVEVGLAVPVDKVAKSVDLEVLSRSMVPCCAGPISGGIELVCAVLDACALGEGWKAASACGCARCSDYIRLRRSVVACFEDCFEDCDSFCSDFLGEVCLAACRSELGRRRSFIKFAGLIAQSAGALLDPLRNCMDAHPRTAEGYVSRRNCWATAVEQFSCNFLGLVEAEGLQLLEIRDRACGA